MEKLREQLDGLVEKYTELLLGETDEELKEQVKMWIIYSHIAKACRPSPSIGTELIRMRSRG